MRYIRERFLYPTEYKTYKNTKKALPNTTVSLRDFYGPIQNQGEEGSCSAFSSLQFRAALRKMAGFSFIDPSQQAQYFEERKLEGTIGQDSGATLEDALEVLVGIGVLPSHDDPYTPDDFTSDPPVKDFDAALKLKRSQVQKIDQQSLLADTLDALATGHPVLFGFQVFSELESPEVAQTGGLTLPGPASQSLGGHAVNAIGFDPAKRMILVLNQWGPDWGIQALAELKGCFWIPYEYYERFCNDAYAGFAG